MRFLRQRVNYGHGWWNESYRHSLAAKGISTRRFNFQPQQTVLVDPQSKLVDPEKKTVTQKIVFKTVEQERPQILSTKFKEQIAQERAGRELVREEFDNVLERIQSGDLSAWEDAQKTMTFSPFQETQLRQAVFKGAMVQSKSYVKPDEKYLSSLGLNKEQIDAVRRAYLRQTTGEEATAAERRLAGLRKLGVEVGEEALEAGEEKLETLGATLKSGARELMKSGETPEQRLARLKKTSLPALGWEAEEEAAGTFSPLKISGIDKIIAEKKAKRAAGEEKTKEEKDWEVYPEAKRSMEEADDFFRNRHQLAKVDMSSYEKGLKAFNKGDREELIKSIFELESENMKLKDRFNVVQEAKGHALSRNSVVQTVHMSHKQGEVLPNFLFGGGGGDKVADQTKKFNQVMDDIKQNSNKLVARISLLYQKLKKVDASISPDRSMPAKEVAVVKGDSLGLTTQFDNFGGQLKHQNPVLEGMQNKDIKNPVFGAPDEMGEIDEV